MCQLPSLIPMRSEPSPETLIRDLDRVREQIVESFDGICMR